MTMTSSTGARMSLVTSGEYLILKNEDTKKSALLRCIPEDGTWRVSFGDESHPSPDMEHAIWLAGSILCDGREAPPDAPATG